VESVLRKEKRSALYGRSSFVEKVGLRRECKRRQLWLRREEIQFNKGSRSRSDGRRKWRIKGRRG